MDEDNCLKEILRLREQMHYLYKRDNRISEAVLNTSVTLDKQINAYLKATNEVII
ncbi:MAG: Spo0E family sporulation regulatory protein-aspartic acid phosphatase [Bacillota bacterium]